MFQVFALRPWKRTYATRVGRRRDGRQDVGCARARGIHRDVGETVSLEERERVRALVLLQPRAVAELDERDEWVEQRADALELGLRLRST